jgi:hypothetical protein
MPSDPLGLQDNPLFKIIGKLANPDTYRGLAGKKTSSIAGSREPMPDYAGMGARQQAGPSKKSKGTPVKKIVKKSVKPILDKPSVKKDKSGKKSYAAKAKVKDSAPMKSTKERGSVAKAKLGKEASRPSSSGHATVAQDGKIKSRAAKGKAADKLVTMKKFVGKKQKV